MATPRNPSRSRGSKAEPKASKPSRVRPPAKKAPATTGFLGPESVRAARNVALHESAATRMRHDHPPGQRRSDEALGSSGTPRSKKAERALRSAGADREALFNEIVRAVVEAIGKRLTKIEARLSELEQDQRHSSPPLHVGPVVDFTKSSFVVDVPGLPDPTRADPILYIGDAPRSRDGDG